MLFKFNVMKNIKQNSVVISYAVVLDSTSVEVSVKHWNSLRLYVELMLGCFPEVISQRIFPSRKFPSTTVSKNDSFPEQQFDISKTCSPRPAVLPDTPAWIGETEPVLPFALTEQLLSRW